MERWIRSVRSDYEAFKSGEILGPNSLRTFDKLQAAQAKFNLVVEHLAPYMKLRRGGLQFAVSMRDRTVDQLSRFIVDLVLEWKRNKREECVE